MKFLATALLLAGASAAPSMTIEEETKVVLDLDIWGMRNWPIFAQAMMEPGFDAFKAGKGEVTFSQCKDSLNDFHLNTKTSTFSPNPLTRGSTVDIHAKGTLDKPGTLDGVVATIYYNGHKLETHNFPGTHHFDKAVDYEIKDKIPLISPPGNYKIHAVAQGHLGSENGDVDAACIEASFDL